MQSRKLTKPFGLLTRNQRSSPRRLSHDTSKLRKFYTIFSGPNLPAEKRTFTGSKRVPSVLTQSWLRDEISGHGQYMFLGGLVGRNGTIDGHFFSIVSCWLLPLTNWFIACWCSATCSSNPLLARWTMDGCGAAELPRDTEKPGHTRLGMSDDTQVLTGGREKTLWPLLAPE